MVSVYRQDSIRSSLDRTIELEMRPDYVRTVAYSKHEPLKFTGLRVGLYFYLFLALTRSTHGPHARTVTYVVVATLP